VTKSPEVEAILFSAHYSSLAFGLILPVARMCTVVSLYDRRFILCNECTQFPLSD